MSTKLYNGIKFKSRDMHKVLEQLFSLREEALKNSMTVLKGRCFKDCCHLIKDAILNAEDKSLSCFEIERLLIANLNSNTRTFNDPDFNLSVCVFPLDDGNIYGYFFNDGISENEELIYRIADDFSYWDNSDPPTNITEEEWLEREIIWDRIFKKSDIFSRAGFTYDIVKADTGFSFERSFLESLYDWWKDNHNIK